MRLAPPHSPTFSETRSPMTSHAADAAAPDMRAGLRLILSTTFDAPLRAAFVLVCAIAGGAVSLVLPAVLAGAVDRVTRGEALGSQLWLLAAVLAVEALASAGGGLAGAGYHSAITAKLRHRYVRHVLALGPAGSQRFATGDLVSRLTLDTPAAGRL